MNNTFKKTGIVFLVLGFLLLAFPVFGQTPIKSNTAVVFVNEACGHCQMYLSNLKMELEKNGFAITEKNMVNDQTARTDWIFFHEQNKIPIEFQGHLTVILNNRLAIEGHVPLSLVRETIQKYPDKDFPLLVLFQDEMVNENQIKSYKVWTPQKAVECKPDQSVESCTPLPAQNQNTFGLVGLVGFSGLIAGIHPCTIGVLLFFLAFLFSIQLLAKDAFKIGAAYILGVFAAYFLIGLGLLQTMVFSDPHTAAKIAAALVFLLGLFNIARYFVPSIKGFKLPGFSKTIIAQNVSKTTIPAAFLVGIVTGICSFGCTAGIYFSVLGFLATNPTIGIPLLVLYNTLFVLPLLVILLLASNAQTVEKISALQARHARKLFLVAGILMVLMAIALWLYVGGA